MSEFKNLVQWVKNEKTGKSRTIKLGYAKEDNKGKLRITMDSLPVPRKNNFGEYSIELCLEEPYNPDGASRGPGRDQYGVKTKPTGGGGFPDADYGTKPEDDDDTPF